MGGRGGGGGGGDPCENTLFFIGIGVLWEETHGKIISLFNWNWCNWYGLTAIVDAAVERFDRQLEIKLQELGLR